MPCILILPIRPQSRRQSTRVNERINPATRPPSKPAVTACRCVERHVDIAFNPISDHHQGPDLIGVDPPSRHNAGGGSPSLDSIGRHEARQAIEFGVLGSDDPCRPLPEKDLVGLYETQRRLPRVDKGSAGVKRRALRKIDAVGRDFPGGRLAHFDRLRFHGTRKVAPQFG